MRFIVHASIWDVIGLSIVVGTLALYGVVLVLAKVQQRKKVNK